MKRSWALGLLVSVGLNLGLGYRLLVGQPDRTDVMGVHPAEQQLRQPPEGRPPGRALRFGPEDIGRWDDWVQLRLDRISRRLDLTESQRRAFAGILTESAGRVGPQLQLVREARRNLRRLTLVAAAPDDSLRRAIRLVGQSQAAMDSLVTETLLAELQVLDPEQRRIYLKLMPLGGDQHRGLPAWGRRGRGPRGMRE